MKKTSLIEQIEQLDSYFDDSYFNYLKDALVKYKEMVESGVLVPRGNRIPNTVINTESYNSGFNNLK